MVDKITLKEENDRIRFERDKNTFHKSKLISKENKILVENYVKLATQNRKNKAIFPYYYSGMRYTIFKKLCEGVFKNITKKYDFEINFEDVDFIKININFIRTKLYPLLEKNANNLIELMEVKNKELERVFNSK
jgi:hypothetical protein